MPRTALRSGAPVTTWFGSEVPSNATAHLRAKRATSRFEAPAMASQLTTTSGTRSTIAATEQGRPA